MLGYLGELRRACDRIGLVPLGARARNDLRGGLRSRSYRRSATIVYRVETDRVLILRILRRGRDVERQFTP